MTNPTLNALVVLGRPSIDTYFRVPHLPAAGEKMQVQSVFTVPGGVAGNFAAHLAAQGAAVTAYSSRATDAAAQLDVADLEAHGVELIWDAASEGPAHQCYIFLAADGQRSILIDEATDADSVNAALARQIAAETKRFDLAYFGVWSVAHRELTQQARRIAARIAATVENSSWPNDASPAEFAHVDVLFCSDETYLAHAEVWDQIVAESDLELVVTHGKAGSEIRTRTSRIFAPIIKDDVSIVDTTGAGDCFAAAYCWHFGRGKRGRQLLDLANAAAQASLATLGPRPVVRGGDQED